MPTNRKRKSKQVFGKPGCQISDVEILEHIESNKLQVCDYEFIWKWNHRQNKFYPLRSFPHRKGNRYYFRLKFGKRQRKIFRARMNWMIHHKQIVPTGMTIDHIDHNNENDHPDNLQLREFMENSRDNWSSKGNGGKSGFE